MSTSLSSHKVDIAPLPPFPQTTQPPVNHHQAQKCMGRQPVGLLHLPVFVSAHAICILACISKYPSLQSSLPPCCIPGGCLAPSGRFGLRSHSQSRAVCEVDSKGVSSESWAWLIPDICCLLTLYAAHQDFSEGKDSMKRFPHYVPSTWP